MRAIAALSFVASSAVAAAAPTASTSELLFTVLLDGKPVGQHRFSVATRKNASGIERSVESDADFTVRFMGIAVYRYRHRSREQWQGDCLSTLNATTDNDGKLTSVQGELEGPSFEIVTTLPGRGSQPTTAHAADACVMSYAYWNPAMRMQTRLLNPETGQIDRVSIAPIADTGVDVRGEPVRAHGWRISGPPHAIDVWYSEDGAWIGLDAVVDHGRRLSYRLR